MYSEINKLEEIRGIKYWKNPINEFNILMLHYTADAEKDPMRDGKKWFENEKKGTTANGWKKEYEIDFTTKSGKLIFGKEFCDFDKDIHLINSFELPSDVEFLFSLDFGQRNPTCGLVGAWTRDNRLYIIDEYYKPALPSVAAREIFNKFDYIIGDTSNKSLRMKRDMAREAFQIMIIDPTTRAKNRSKTLDGEEIQYSVIEEFYDHGLDFSPGNNDVDAGITRIREYFQLDENLKAHLYIFKDKCPNLSLELQTYRYKELSDLQKKTQNQSDTPIKKDDHAVDALKYLIMSRPMTPSQAPGKLTKIQEDIKRVLKPKAFSSNWDNDSII